MEIYVYDNKYFLGDNPLREIIKYKSEIIPRINEHIYLTHYGTFQIKNIIYHFTDDRVFQELMWVEIYVENLGE